MPGRRLPPRPNLDQYRKQAKELLSAVRAGDAGARRLFRVHHPRRPGEIDVSRFRLADAQLVVAREHGFTSWTTFAVAVQALASGAADTRASTVQLDITTDEINTCALTPDGRRAITAAQGNPVTVWDARTGRSGRTQRVLTGHTYHVHGLAWSGDGRRLLSCSMDLRLWDAETGRCLRTFEGHSKIIRSVAWSADERYGLTASHDGTARLWRLDTGLCERLFEGHEIGLVSASFSRDGRRIFTCDWLGGIRTWSLG